MMASAEKIGWLATKTPQEGDALYSNDSGSQGGSGKDVATISSKDPASGGNKLVLAIDAQGDGGAPPGWPSRGTVEFDNVWMKYLPSAPYALKGELWVLLGGGGGRRVWGC
jgi:hypothetical protein